MTTREFITLHVAQGEGAPTIDLIHAARQRIVVFAQLAEPQPANLPPGLVAIVLPPNCYFNPYQDGDELPPA